MNPEIPLFKRGAKVVSLDQRVVIEYLQDQITLEGDGAILFGKIYPLLDGKMALDGIAARVAERPARVRSFLSELERAGVIALYDGADVDSDRGGLSGREFYALHHKYGSFWLRPVYQHPLWERIVSGQASRAQVLGFAFEKYHYIEGAYEHMAIAAANATPAMMPHLARHFIEEFAHGDIYRRGLCALFDDHIVVHARPLPSTRALVNFLSETAARSSFSYYAGNELLQMTENRAEPDSGRSIDQFYDAMRAHYPYTAALIDAFVAHTQADQKLGHESVFAEMCDAVPRLSAKEARDALETTRFMAEHLLLFLDGIDAACGRLTPVPRLPVDLGTG
jgi:pyrroloquinoline quinone (PQQ) biosynthesis protein C